MPIENKLCLGTAKLGMPEYGCSDGVILNDPLSFILRALDRGVIFLDTSPRYGNSEKLIGEALELTNKKPCISTKIDDLQACSSNTPNLMVESIHESINKLGRPIDICYLHQNNLEIISDKFVHEGIKLLKKDNLVREVGTSVYSKDELLYTLDCGAYDWVQIPVNVLDTSFYRIASMHSSKIKIAARSVFLQGLLFNENRAVSNVNNHGELIKTLASLRKLCFDFDISLEQLSIAYLSSIQDIKQIIVGTISDHKLQQNLESLSIKLDDSLIDSVDGISATSKSWTNPRSWKL